MDGSRAGCNYSAISGNDENALRWDRLGYAHLAKLASEQSDEAFIKRTPSIEFWDENVPRDKIKTMSEYLEDVSVLACCHVLSLVDIKCSLGPFRPTSFQPA